MELTNAIAASGVTAASDLRGVMRGKVMLPTDADYARTRQVWNGATKHDPALFARYETGDDVQAAVRAARVHGLPLWVRSGGHD
jgi:FAD/FMN-containing dehydrogenase